MAIPADPGPASANALFRLGEIMSEAAKAREAFDRYETARADGLESTDARARVAEEMKLSSHDIASYIAAGRVAHEREKEIQAAFNAGKSVEEISALIRSPLPPIKRGRRPGSKSQSQRTKAGL